MLRPGYPIETARLSLRPFVVDDLDALYAYHSRPDVVRYLYWEPRDRAQAEAALDHRLGQGTLERDGTSLVLAVVWREAGAVVGEVNLAWLSEKRRQGELGFAGLGLHRIIGRCDPRNRPSVALLERLGMRREAHFVDNEIFKAE